MAKSRGNKGFFKELARASHGKHEPIQRAQPLNWKKPLSGGQPQAEDQGTMRRLRGRISVKQENSFVTETSKYIAKRRGENEGNKD